MINSIAFGGCPGYNGFVTVKDKKLSKHKTGVKIREVILYPGEDGYWVVECPSLPGCLSQGKTKKEAIKNIKEAINCYIHALEEDNLPVPV